MNYEVKIDNFAEIRNRIQQAIKNENQMPKWGGLSPAYLTSDANEQAQREWIKEDLRHRTQAQMIAQGSFDTALDVLLEMLEACEYMGEAHNTHLLEWIRAKRC
jgi:hypothetical protein